MNDLCYKTSNNKYFQCPPLMSDGRAFTDYRPNCYVNNLVRTKNDINNSFQYRTYLTNNAENLMDINRTNACQKNCCGPCQKPYNIGTMLPEQNINKCTSSVCGTLVTNPNGLGTGRSNSQDTGSCSNWPNTLPFNQPKDCCTPEKNNFNYYPYDRKQVAINRLTSPGGGVALTGGDADNYY